MFDIGQRILCIDSTSVLGDEDPVARLNGLTAGEVYHVRDCSPVGIDPETLEIANGVVLLNEVRLPMSQHGEPAFCAQRFRPLDDPGLEVFRAAARDKIRETDDA
ncbi:hypothetical protein [Hyphomicrobium sp.]|uniref:hypothetical protein n=1 Tax=Hyphomicrobium sp. TaxID=82 RepID=UPI001DD9A053|nr:hypothetical protein [Hyphomicrobium sp.]MBY0561498.1 hypothetical protein [Hyphomicrobium sp.]